MLFSDPEDKIAEVNEWAQFNCTARCDYSVGWYMAGHSKVIKRNNTVPGLLIKRLRPSSCIESNKRTHFIEVLATEAFNKSTFYCAAYERHQESCSCGTGGRCYSRPALLTGEQCVFVRFTFYQSNPQTSIYYCLPAVIIIDMTLKYHDYIFYAHRIITYAVRMAPTVSPPSQTTGTPEITPPHSSTSPTLQGTQTHKNQLKVTFI